MSVTVRVPTTLRTLTGGQSEVAVDGSTVGEVLANLEAAHPGIGAVSLPVFVFCRLGWYAPMRFKPVDE